MHQSIYPSRRPFRITRHCSRRFAQHHSKRHLPPSHRRPVNSSSFVPPSLCRIARSIAPAPQYHWTYVFLALDKRLGYSSRSTSLLLDLLHAHWDWNVKLSFSCAHSLCSLYSTSILQIIRISLCRFRTLSCFPLTNLVLVRAHHYIHCCQAIIPHHHPSCDLRQKPPAKQIVRRFGHAGRITAFGLEHPQR